MSSTPRLNADLVDEVIDGLAAIRRQFDVPTAFPDEVLAAATVAAANQPSPATGHADLTDVPFVTLDPASSTDLDQALWVEAEGSLIVLQYAIADVAYFVPPGGVIDAEAWRRGLTTYLPDAKAPLYPAALAERAASLLADGPRPAIVFDITLDTDGTAVMRRCRRGIIASRAKLAYDAVTDSQLPPALPEFARRMAAAEAARGASRVEFPEQEVERDADAPGGYRLSLRPRLESEERNAALSLAANLAVADAMYAAGVGLFRVMAEPDERDERTLRHIARSVGVTWAKDESLQQLERRLKPTNASDAAMALAIRRAGGGASYAAFDPAVKPWHAAMAAPYAHATAPLRRLADRYVLEAALALSSDDALPPHVSEAFGALPDVMRQAEQRSAQVERAVNDLIEAVLLSGRIGDTFNAVVIDTDRHGARIQLSDEPVIARVDVRRAEPGDEISVRLDGVDLDERQLTFTRVR